MSHKKGSKPFTLTNTNKLIRGYEGCVGLKTGSTSKAKYCVSAVAKKNDLTMLAVVMGAPDYKVRFADAASLFQYGFSSCSIYIDRERDPLPELRLFMESRIRQNWNMRKNSAILRRAGR